MPGSTEAVAETAIVEAHRSDPQTPMDWHQRFPASMSHEGHDVPDVGAVFEEHMTPGQRAADAVARQLGSWRFLIIQSCLLAAWMVLNIAELLFKPFDPYPFILLNLALSFQAAYAAPVLLMSANRQAQKDRLNAHSASVVGQRAEEENRAILHHLEAQDELMIVLLRSLKAIESRVLETVDRLEEGTVEHYRDALRQALRDDGDSTL
jgi:uncharacterized membrane protein